MKEIIKHLQVNSKPFNEITKFSDQPGIYALFFYGNSFPLNGYTQSKNEIIYIGKTESSQKSRDADTHFASGKTGSSTLRKSFGSLLHDEFKLVPIPRSQSDIDKGRHAHFKFDFSSEKILTDWMQNNLGLSFYPFTKSTLELDAIETQLINMLVPILNIDRKNTANPYFDYIRAKRKQMSELAYGVNKTFAPIKTKIDTKPQSLSLKKAILSGSIHKYEDIWKQVIPYILDSMENNNDLQVDLDQEAFNKVGNRKSYSFNVEFENGVVANNIDGSAVARDLARVLLNNIAFVKHAKARRIKIKMSKDFLVEMQL